jgi:3-oxoacyl-[acyl-carrier protein] reductase
MMTKDWKLSGRKAVVTGCENVLGDAIAKALVAEGVSVCRVANDSKAGDVVANYAQEGAAADVAKQAGAVEILVNVTSGLRNAVSTPVDVSLDDWQTEMRTEFVFSRELAHATMSDMIKNKWGRIVNLVGSSEPMDFGIEYAASGALQGWAKGLSRGIGKHGVTINCIQPGIINGTAAVATYKHLDTVDTEEPVIAFGEPGEPDDIAHAVVFLCTPFANYISGIVLPVDGGLARHQH